MRFGILTLAAITLLPFQSRSQDTAFVKAIRSHASPFEIVGGRLRGFGADALSRVARDHQFIMVGEDHGIREVPQFVAALWETARPHGFSHVGVEIGPVSGANLERMMRRPSAQREMDAFLTRYTSFALPFFFWKEESEMLEEIVKSLPAGRDVVWGLDQEFMLAPTYLFDRLTAIAPNAAARRLAAAYAEASGKGDRAMYANSNPSGLWMVSSTDADIPRLRSAFKPRVGSEADVILTELALSRDIYGKFSAGLGYESNQQRDDLMKTNFMRFYRAAQARGEKLPKAIVKLGANHVFRGPSITSTYEIGSFIPELAVMNGTKSFGILLLAGKGTWNAYRPFGSKESDKTQAYDPLTTPEYAVFDLKSVMAAAGNGTWTFVDLRPLRAMSVSGPLRRLGPEAKRLLNSFDGVVVAPEAHASAFLR